MLILRLIVNNLSSYHVFSLFVFHGKGRVISVDEGRNVASATRVLNSTNIQEVATLS